MKAQQLESMKMKHNATIAIGNTRVGELCTGTSVHKSWAAEGLRKPIGDAAADISRILEEAKIIAHVSGVD